MMNILKQFGKSVGKAVGRLEEKNRLAAQVNRIRSIMKREQKAAEKEYITLGRYYYQNLRDKDNATTEKHCAAVDQIEIKLNAAMDQLEALYCEAAKDKAEEIEEITLDDITELDMPPEEPLPFADTDE